MDDELKLPRMSLSEFKGGAMLIEDDPRDADTMY